MERRCGHGSPAEPVGVANGSLTHVGLDSTRDVGYSIHREKTREPFGLPQVILASWQSTGFA